MKLIITYHKIKKVSNKKNLIFNFEYQFVGYFF